MSCRHWVGGVSACVVASGWLACASEQNENAASEDAGQPSVDAAEVEDDAAPKPDAARCKLDGLLTVADWEATFLASWQYEYETYLPLSTSNDSWRYYNLAYAISANSAMFEATGKTQYLDRALEYIGNAIEDATLSSTLATSQFKDSYLGWVQHSHPELGDDGKEYPLYESYCWRYVASLLRLMKESDAVYAEPGYRAKYDSILTFSEKHIYEKWRTRGAQHIYRQNTHMASHWARIALNLQQLSDDAATRSEYFTVFDNFTNHLPSYDSSMKNQIKPNPGEPSAYWWNANWGSFTAPGQDVSHGNAVIGHLVEAHELGFEWTEADMRGLVNLLDKVVWTTSFAQYLDGSGSGNGWINDGFVTLGRFDPALQARLEQHPAADNGGQFAATMALNAMRLSEACVSGR